MGQFVEWPEVVTKGKDLEEWLAMLRNALNEMRLTYKELDKEIPLDNALSRCDPTHSHEPFFCKSQMGG
jgi:predicted RNase H-like HicB family nuclease